MWQLTILRIIIAILTGFFLFYSLINLIGYVASLHLRRRAYKQKVLKVTKSMVVYLYFIAIITIIIGSILFIKFWIKQGGFQS